MAENPADLKKSFAINLVDPDDPDELDGEDDEDDVPIWTREQFRSFHEHAREDYFYLAHCIVVIHGKRRGEVLGIKWPRVDLDTGEIRQKGCAAFPWGRDSALFPERPEEKGKNGKRKSSSIVLGPEATGVVAAALVKQHETKDSMGDRYRDEGWMFCRQDGKPYDPKTCSTHFEKICAKQGFPATTLHHLRHIFTTYMHDCYLSLRKVEELVGSC